MEIVILGGGAAGFFAAISAKKHFPQAHVRVFEKTSKFLGKVKISGGGRCNVTNALSNHRLLSEKYPRGEKFLRKAFEQFDTKATMDWFENRGVPLKTYSDLCVFPESNESQSIIDCLWKEAKTLGVELWTLRAIDKITPLENGFEISYKEVTEKVDRVIVTIGGQPKMTGFSWLEDLNHHIIPPIPSLFTFNMPQEPIRELMGIVVEQAVVRIEGQKLLGKGPLLITHWGMSGTAILQLSAWGALILAESNYEFSVLVNWLHETKENTLRENLGKTIIAHGSKMISNLNPFEIPNRLWLFLLAKNEINPATRWNDLGAKNTNKLVNTLLNDRYVVQGKTTFKEEFVTAGGVDLKEIDVNTMQSKIHPGLFFAGEVMDIDGITGGFNFQSAWTTGYIAGKNVGN